MSRSYKQEPRGPCPGCTKCDWYPKRLSRAGRHDAKRQQAETADESDLGLLHYDLACERGDYDD